MQITDNREQILLGVQRLRAMASSSHTSPSSLGIELSIASSSAIHSPSLRYELPSTDHSSIRNMEVSMDSSPVQLELLPLRPSCQKAIATSAGLNLWGLGFNAQAGSRGIDVNQLPSTSASEGDEEVELEAPTVLQLSGLAVGKRELIVRERGNIDAAEHERAFLEVSSRASDDEESGSARKKLRLSKEQSALLEESFKEHSTLNPKQKSALAKQLKLRPRQVEVWFQNRRARTKLKQTEVDCELLKRCCESLTEENRRLQKEVAELRALKVGAPFVISHDFYMPAATLTMCPSCESLGPHGSTTISTPTGSEEEQIKTKIVGSNTVVISLNHYEQSLHTSHWSHQPIPFGGGPSNPYLLHNHEVDQVIYARTHDNATAVGWWQRAIDEKKATVGLYNFRLSDKPFLLHTKSSPSSSAIFEGPGYILIAHMIVSMERSQDQGINAFMSKVLELCKEKHVHAKKHLGFRDPRGINCEELENFPVEILAIGNHGYGPVKRVVLNNVSDHCVHPINCPAMIVRKPLNERASEGQEHGKGYLQSVADTIFGKAKDTKGSTTKEAQRAREKAEQTARRGKYDNEKSGTQKVKDAASEKVEHAKDTAHDVTERAKDTTSDTSQRAKDQAYETSQQAKEKAIESAKQSKESTKGLLQSVTETLSERAGVLKVTFLDKIEEVKGKAGDIAKQAKQKASQTIEGDIEKAGKTIEQAKHEAGKMPEQGKDRSHKILESAKKKGGEV
ncbi:hypothetical protein L7F22_036471 [Adiantum nelumboides]|nr:hypothetical protein [Adiantum nelumboides]